MRISVFFAGVVFFTFLSYGTYLSASGIAPSGFLAFGAVLLSSLSGAVGVSIAGVTASLAAVLLLIATLTLGVYFRGLSKEHPDVFASVMIARQWANTIYYLGFFGTLVSLIATILAYNLGSGATDIGSMFSGAALAISSTAAAIVLRTVWMILAQSTFTQTRSDGKSPTIAAEDMASSLNELTLAARKAKSELASFKKEVSALKISPDDVTTALVQGFDNALAPTRSAQQEFATSTSKASAKLGGLSTRFGTAENRLIKLNKSLDVFSASLEKAAESSAKMRKPGIITRFWQWLV